MKVQIKKWGNSYAIRIPKNIIDKLELKENAELELYEDPEGFSLSKQTKEELLAQLLKEMTPENRHEEIDWGEPVGKEVW